MASQIVRVDSITNKYDHFNVTPVPHVIRREANQLDLPTGVCGAIKNDSVYNDATLEGAE